MSRALGRLPALALAAAAVWPAACRRAPQEDAGKPPQCVPTDHGEPDPRFLLDPALGRIGGVAVRDGIEAIRTAVGRQRVRKETELLEGDPHDVFVISVQGHEVRKHWNAASIKDPVFRTAEGLGVGSRVCEFVARYGSWQRDEDGLHWDSGSPRFHFAVSGRGSEASDATQLVSEIWVW